MKNQIAEFVHWFYVYYLGQPPDASSYNYGTALLRDMMDPGPNKFKDAISYSSVDLANLAYYLRDQGVAVEGLEIFKTYDLARSYVTQNHKRLERLVKFFLASQGERGASAVAPDGW